VVGRGKGRGDCGMVEWAFDYRGICGVSVWNARAIAKQAGVLDGSLGSLLRFCFRNGV
jgi:hypothetical protein